MGEPQEAGRDPLRILATSLIISQVPLLSKPQKLLMPPAGRQARLKASLMHRGKAMVGNAGNGGGRRGSRWG
jgi:hypothetical protein